MSANDKQVAGTHYRAEVQHWDMVVMHALNYFEGQITKYVMRARKKNGLQDLQKAHHFLEKYMEVYSEMVQASIEAPPAKPDPQASFKEDAKPFENSRKKIITPATAAWHQDENWQCEGFYGNWTQLYRCRHCRTLVRTTSIDDAYAEHGQCAGPGYVSQE